MGACGGERAHIVHDMVDQVSKVFFHIVHVITKVAPIGAFGAMSFTVGKYGVAALVTLGKLMAGVYLTCAAFVFVVLAGILAAIGEARLTLENHPKPQRLQPSQPSAPSGPTPWPP